jgi:peptidylprolyl isomerase
MNRFVLVLTLAAATLAASAQTPSKPSAPASTAPKAVPAAGTTSKNTSSTATTTAPWIKLPPGVPAVAHGPVKTSPVVVHYYEIKVGTGAEGESGKLWHLKYTGWRAADGVQFDSWDWHPQPVRGPDGKPVMGPDGKPKMGDPEPAQFPQGVGAVIPGFDYGLEGLRINGKRRIFIPWQLAYGMRDQPARPSPAPGMHAFPGIPAKSDLIFEVELVDVTEMPARPAMTPPQSRPQVPPHPTQMVPSPGAQQNPGAGMPPNATPAQHPETSAPAAPVQPATPAPAATPAKPAAPTTPAPTSAPAQPPSK